MQTVKDIKYKFKDLLINEEYVIDKSGVKTIEIVGSSFIADEDHIITKPNKEYIKTEIDWYNSMSRNVYDIPNTPLIWKQVASPSGLINSNYGWCIFSEENGYQFNNTYRTLNKDKDSRRAIMLYTRPQMQYEFNTDGMSDFMCTNSVQYLIRNNKIDAVVNMRSNDAIFGYNNDYAWQHHVLSVLTHKLKKSYPKLEMGKILWQTGSIHVYERHFHMVAGTDKMTWDNVGHKVFENPFG